MSNKEIDNKEFHWVRKPEQIGEFLFTFDGEKIYNLFHDYPHELTDEEKALFDAENPYWVNFFKHRDEKLNG